MRKMLELVRNNVAIVKWKIWDYEKQLTFLAIVTIARNVAVLDSHIVGDENAIVRSKLQTVRNNVAEMSHHEKVSQLR